MGYKLTTEDCRNVLKGDTGAIHEKTLKALFIKLSLENDVPSIYRLQGQIAQIIDESGLKDKANKQLQNIK